MASGKILTSVPESRMILSRPKVSYLSRSRRSPYLMMPISLGSKFHHSPYCYRAFILYPSPM